MSAQDTALRKPMNIATGGKAVAVALVAEVTGTAAGSDAITVALISVAGGFVVMVSQIVITDWLRGRRDRQRQPHHPDYAEEQAELHDRYLERLLHMEEQLQHKDAEIERLRRRKP